jgi:long-chain acyl-CoA synthetase
MYEPRREHLADLLQDVARWTGRDLIVQGDRRISTEKFLGAVTDVATHLVGAGVRPGDRVLLLAPNSPEWVVAFWAAATCGAIVVPANGWWSAEELGHAVELVEPAVVIADEQRFERLDADVPRIDIAELHRLVEAAPLRSTAPPVVAVDGSEDDPVVIVFTSGTTGLPKGAVLAHRSIIGNLHNMLVTSKRLPHLLPRDGRGQVSLHTFPLFHIGGIQVMCFSMLTGGTMVFLEGRFSSGTVLDLIERERVELWGAIPTMAMRVLDDPTLTERNLESIRSISLGGAPVSAELVRRLATAFPNLRRAVSANYGMTEAGGSVASASGSVMADNPGTSGRPLPVVELRIDRPDETGAGEILVRTPGQMLGYWQDPDNDLVDHEGFLHTGDLGRVTEGLLWVVGRSKDVVIRGGENVAAAHVEAVLLEHPAVAEVAVVGLPHEEWGEEVAALVVPKRGVAVTADELAAFAAGRLAHFEVPAHWWFRSDPIPVNGTGKVDKRVVRAEWQAR